MSQTNAQGAVLSECNTPDNPLPVLDIVNNIITAANYVSAIQNAVLPKAITDNTLVTNYNNWRYNIWQQYFEALIDANIVAQVQEMNELIASGITEQAILSAIVMPPSADTPSVITLIDDVTSLIAVGVSYLTQLQQIAGEIQNADKAKIAVLDQIISTLNSQFDSMEDKLTNEALDNSVVAVVTVINVAVAVGTDTNPVTPLVKGVSQIGTDIVSELNLSDDINATLSQLETAWSQLDDISLQLTQINLIINKLNHIVNETTETITALNNIVNDWQTISNTFSLTKDDWNKYGLSQVTEWAGRMSRVVFCADIVQTVSTV